MFDAIFEFMARILNLTYTLVPNYAIAIMLLTLIVMIVTTPLTLKGTRSMIKMQLLQPEMKRIQTEFRDDREAMNREMMTLYQEQGINPLGCAGPMLIQMPVFLILFRLLRGLTRTDDTGFFDPQYLDPESKLYRALHGTKEMVAFGLDLSESATSSLGESVLHGLPYLALILLMVALQYYQQKQVSARNTTNQSNPQQQMLLKVMPAMFAVFSIGFPAALVVYWLSSSMYRIGLQYYITKSLYGDEDSLGAQASKATAEARRMHEESKGKSGTKSSGKAGDPAPDADGGDDAPSSNGSSARGKDKARPDKGAANGSSKPPATPKPIGGGGRVTPTNKSKPHPSSKKKKRKRR